MSAALRVADVAQRWNCSAGKVRQLINAGELPALHLGTMLRVPVASLVAYEARCQIAPASPASAAVAPDARNASGIASLRAARIEQRQRRS